MKTEIKITHITNYTAWGTWEGDQTTAEQLVAMLPIKGTGTFASNPALYTDDGHAVTGNATSGQWSIGTRIESMTEDEATTELERLGAIREISIRDEEAPLYMHYSGQINPQSAYLEIAQDGSIDAAYDAEIGNGVPANVWHGQRRRLPIPNELSKMGVLDLIEDHCADLQTLIAGMDDNWDGSNWIGTLTETASAAYDRLDALNEIDIEDYCHIEVADANDVDTRDLLGDDETITAETTDDEIEAMAERIRAEWESNLNVDHLIVTNLIDALTDHRGLIRESAED